MIAVLVIAALFGGVLILGGIFSPTLDSSGQKTAMRLGALVLLVCIGPIAYETLKVTKDGFSIKTRYQPTQEERNLALSFSQEPTDQIEQEAKVLIKEAEQRSNEQRSPEDFLALATKNFMAKNYDEALHMTYAGLDLNPENTQTRATLIYRKGTIFNELGLPDKAIKSYKEAIQVDPKFSRPHNRLGWIYFEKKEYKKAKLAQEQALRLDPQNKYALKLKKRLTVALENDGAQLPHT